MSGAGWGTGELEADNDLGTSEPFLYFPQTASYPSLPGERLLVRSAADGGVRRLIARTAWATTQEAEAPLYAHAATLARLALRPGQRATIRYRPARWWHVLFWGDNVAIAVAVAVLTVVSTALTAFVLYRDNSMGIAARCALIALFAATLAAVINVFQQFLA